eukprot:tig00001375_g8515.t1
MGNSSRRRRRSCRRSKPTPEEYARRAAKGLHTWKEREERELAQRESRASIRGLMISSPDYPGNPRNRVAPPGADDALQHKLVCKLIEGFVWSWGLTDDEDGGGPVNSSRPGC